MSTSEKDQRDEMTSEMPGGMPTLADEAESAAAAQRDTTADALQSFADTIQEKTGSMPGGDGTTEAGAVAARGLERAADFVYERHPRQIVGEVQAALRDQPLVAIATGVLVGFIAGRMSK